MTIKLLSLLILSSLTAAFGQILFKLGASGSSAFLDFLNSRIIAGLLCYGISTVIWIFCLSRAQLTVVYVFTVLTFVLVYIMAFIVFDDRLTIYGYLGIVMILIGLYLVLVKGV